MEKVNINIEFCMFEFVSVTNFRYILFQKFKFSEVVLTQNIQMFSI